MKAFVARLVRLYVLESDLSKLHGSTIDNDKVNKTKYKM